MAGSGPFASQAGLRERKGWCREPSGQQLDADISERGIFAIGKDRRVRILAYPHKTGSGHMNGLDLSHPSRVLRGGISLSYVDRS